MTRLGWLKRIAVHAVEAIATNDRRVAQMHGLLLPRSAALRLTAPPTPQKRKAPRIDGASYGGTHVEAAVSVAPGGSVRLSLGCRTLPGPAAKALKSLALKAPKPAGVAPPQRKTPMPRFVSIEARLLVAPGGAVRLMLGAVSRGQGTATLLHGPKAKVPKPIAMPKPPPATRRWSGGGGAARPAA